MSMVASSGLSRAPRPSSLADVLDLILDKGLVVDAYVRVSVAGIELLTIDARVVVASVDTYLRFAEAVNRLDLAPTEQQGIKALTGSQDDSEDGDDDEQSNGRSASQQDGRKQGSRQTTRNSPTRQQNRESQRGNDRGEEEDEDESDDESRGLIGRLVDRARFEQ